MRKGISFVVTAAAVLARVPPGRPADAGRRAGAATSIAAVPSEKGGQDVFGAYDVAAWPKPLIVAARPRDVDVGRRAVACSPRARTASSSCSAASCRSSKRPQAADQAPANRAEHRVPDVPPAAARRDDGEPSGSAVRPGRQDTGRRSGCRQARRRLPLGAHRHRLRCAGQPDRGLDAVGQDVPPAARRLHQPVRCRRRTSGSSTTTATRSSSSRNDGKKLLQTIGEPNVPGTDDKHFYRPTFMAWLPDGTFFVADGYQNTRVVKFDKDGKYLMTWGQRGTPPEKRPGYFNNVHGIAVDPQTRRVFVNDREQRPRAGVRRERQVSRRVELRPAAGRRTSTCSSSRAIGSCGPPTAARRSS